MQPSQKDFTWPLVQVENLTKQDISLSRNYEGDHAVSLFVVRDLKTGSTYLALTHVVKDHEVGPIQALQVWEDAIGPVIEKVSGEDEAGTSLMPAFPNLASLLDVPNKVSFLIVQVGHGLVDEDSLPTPGVMVRERYGIYWRVLNPPVFYQNLEEDLEPVGSGSGGTKVHS